MAKKEKNNKQAWNSFRNYWNRTSYKDLDRDEIKEMLDGSDASKLKIPSEITRKNGGALYKEIRRALIPARASNFGGAKVCFKGVKATGEDIFSKDEITYGELNKALHSYIRENNLKVGGKATESKKAAIEEEEEEE